MFAVHLVRLAALTCELVAPETSRGVPRDHEDPAAWPRDYQLEWNAPQECPSRDDVEALVEGLLEGPRFGDTGTVQLRASITVSEDGYVMILRSEFRGATDKHELHERSCSVLAETVALIVVATLDPNVPPPVDDVSAVPEPVPPNVDQPDSRNALRRVPAPEPQTPRRSTDQTTVPLRSRSWSPRSASRRVPGATFGLSLGPEIGALGVATADVQGWVGPAWRHWGIEAYANFVLPRTISEGTVEGQFWQWTAGTRACGRPTRPPFEFPLCLGAEVGQIVGTRRDLLVEPSARHVWIGPAAQVSLVWVRNLVGICASLGTAVRLVGADFGGGGVELVRAWPVSLRGLLGIYLRLPPRNAGNADKG